MEQLLILVIFHLAIAQKMWMAAALLLLATFLQRLPTGATVVMELIDRLVMLMVTAALQYPISFQ
jgi:hypothetical protein